MNGFATMTGKMATKNTASPAKHVVIVGGGFAGLSAARRLAGQPGLHVSVVSDSPLFRYCPALYRVATGYMRRQALMPVRDILPTDIELKIATVTRINRRKRQLTTDKKETLRYDYAILALGVVTTFFGIKGLERYAYGIKSAEDLNRLHDHLHEQLTSTHALDSNYVVVGGGPTGVELAAGLVSYLKKIAKKHRLKRHRVKLEIIEAAPRLLPTFLPRASALAERRLKRLGVKVMPNTKVESETSSSLLAQGRSLPTKTVIWTAGVTNHTFYKNNSRQFQLSDRGRVVVDDYLRVDQHLYVIGDNAETPFSGQAETAVRMGKFVAADIHKRQSGQPSSPYHHHRPTYVVPVGSNWAVMQWRGWVIGGWLAGQMGFTQVNGFIAAVIVAVFGSLVVRLALNAMSDR